MQKKKHHTPEIITANADKLNDRQMERHAVRHLWTNRQTDEKSLKLYMVELLSDCNYFKLLKYVNEGVKQHLAKYLLYIFASLNAD